MGYKRMKKRKVTEYDTFLSAARKAYREMQGLLGIKYVVPDNRMFVDVTLAGKSTPYYSYNQNTGVITLRGDDAERLKWFESPNAEGYLDM